MYILKIFIFSAFTLSCFSSQGQEALEEGVQLVAPEPVVQPVPVVTTGTTQYYIDAKDAYGNPQKIPVQVQADALQAQKISGGFNDIQKAIWDLETQYNDNCKPKQQRAGSCCNTPERCIGGGDGSGSGSSLMSIGYQMLQMIGGVAAASAGAAQACKKMQTISYATAAINAAMAGTCSSAVNQCKSICTAIKERATELKKLATQMEAVYPGDLAAKRQLPLEANRIEKDAIRANEECMTADNATIRHAMQSIAAAQAAKMAGLCKKETEQVSPTPTEAFANTDFNVDCASPAGMSNPICQQHCSRPGAENDPVCRAYLDNLNGGGGLGNADLGDGQGGFDVGALGDENQVADPEYFAPEDSGLASVEGSGGGMGGGIAPSMDGGGDFGMDDAGGMLDFNSKILKGLSSGQGYSSSAGGAPGGGGFRGYGGKSAAKKPNLREFLPGGKNAPMRGIASLTLHPEIGAKTDDIFKRITNRFHAICMQDRLYDCHTLRKMKSPQ